MINEMDKKTSRDLNIMYLLTFLFMVGNMIPNPLVAGYAVYLGAGAALMSLIGGLASFFAFVFRPIVGNMADCMSKRRLLVIGMSLLLSGTILHLVAVSPYVLAVGRIIFGVGFTFCSVSVPVWMSTKVDRNSLGRVISVYGTMNAIALAVAPALGVSIYMKMGYKTVFTILTGILVAGLLCVFLVEADKPSSESLPKEKIKVQLVSKEAVPVSCITMLQCMIYFATQAYLVQYTEIKGLNISVSLFFPIYAVLLTVIRIGVGRIIERIPFSFFFWLSVVSMTGFIISMSLMKTNVGMTIAAIFLAMGYGIMYPVCQAKAIMNAGKGKEGLGNSTFYMGLDIGVTLGGSLGGVIFTSLPVNMFFPCLFLAVPVFVVIYLIWIRGRQ